MVYSLYHDNIADSGEIAELDSVDIFDLASYASAKTNGSWYTQFTADDIPPALIDSCTVLASAPDNSSHSIYMYGGWDPTATDNSTTYFDDTRKRHIGTKTTGRSGNAAEPSYEFEEKAKFELSHNEKQVYEMAGEEYMHMAIYGAVRVEADTSNIFIDVAELPALNFGEKDGVDANKKAERSKEVGSGV
ncbi:uncharacterized protein M421DRAFT_6778 [Didymella exigua CBS 183.55]|uniref:Uncharacterized protein n=1 Tax=Didymella exigua CBS 183.55 TaxID=1150837 RepID=A0A6A5RIG1_9PLEO|nr:uncharacterized protein M421DRAFT_6778 [Didymella exigua CBS 183.55]KAF1926874.1 hypothetical protein M421DRAFT_6778 [Didymella exigua CBS 183.55]